ncbi:MAG: hypothetical protein HC883_05740 [Bdellovibrionaceae bacterium]|nr:hypothetical protein [Pseudobdellovibrionaceae bacterium]
MRISNIVAGVLLLTSSMAAYAQDEGRGTDTIRGTGLFLEPGVTYQVTESSVDYSVGSLGNSSATTRGFGVVLRGGVHVYERFFVAADGRYAMLNYRDNGNNISTDARSWDLAPVLGLQMADYGVRIYGGYVLAGNLPSRLNSIDKLKVRLLINIASAAWAALLSQFRYFNSGSGDPNQVV